MKKILLVLIIGFIAFSPVLKAHFINWDDGDLLSEEKLNPQGIKNIFTSNPISTFIPLTVFSFAVENAIFEQNPLAYHFDNLILHLSVVFLICLLIWLLGFNINIAVLTGLLFCIHPIHVESVAWVTERKDVLYSIFYLSSIIFYIIYNQRDSEFYIFSPTERRETLYLISLALCGLSILAKPMALSLPLILILIDWYLKRKFSKIMILDKIPFFLAIIPVAAVTFVQNHQVMTKLDGANSPILWLWTFNFYLQKFLFPVSLTHSYPYFSQPIVTVCAAVAIIASLFILRKHRIYLFAFGFYFLSIFFLLRVHVTPYDVVADRFMYLPSLGFCLLFAVLLNKIPNRYLSGLTVLVISGALFFQTFNQSKVWKNSFTFWSHVNENNPDSETAWYYLAKAAYNDESYREALYDLNNAADDVDSSYLEARIYKKIYKSLYDDLDSKNYARGLRNVNFLIARDNTKSEYFHWRGLLNVQLGYNRSGIEDYHRAFDLTDNKYNREVLLRNVEIAQAKIDNSPINQLIKLKNQMAQRRPKDEN